MAWGWGDACMQTLEPMCVIHIIKHAHCAREKWRVKCIRVQILPPPALLLSFFPALSFDMVVGFFFFFDDKWITRGQHIQWVSCGGMQKETVNDKRPHANVLRAGQSHHCDRQGIGGHIRRMRAPDWLTAHVVNVKKRLGNRVCRNLQHRWSHVGGHFASVHAVVCGGRLFLCELENIEKFMMLNKRGRWFHSSRVKLPLVNMSVSWFLVSTFLLWILGSSKMYNWGSKCQGFALTTSRLPCLFDLVLGLVLWISLRARLLGTWSSTFSSRQWPLTAWWVLFEECNTSVTTSDRSRAGIPSIRKPASKDITSVSVELWDTNVCFLHVQLMGTNVRLPKIHKILPRLIKSLEGCQQSLSLGTEPCFHTTILSVISRAMNVWNQTSQAFGTGSCPFCDCSSKFVHRRKTVWSTNLCQI